MSYIGQGLPADTFQGFVTDSFTGDGSATTFTLSKEPFSEDTLIVVINNVIQKPTTNFTVSGTTLTIVGTAVASGDVIYAIHMAGPLPVGDATKAAQLDLNGASDKLILDADGDTTISADTDDQVDIKIAGADDIKITANKFELLSGTSLDMDGLSTSVAAGDIIASAGKVATQTVAHNTTTKSAIATEVIDRGSNFDTSNNRFVAPKAGTYYIAGGARSNSFAADRTIAIITKNGSDIGGVVGTQSGEVASTANSYWTVRAESIVDLAVDDYIELLLYQNSGSSQTFFEANLAVFRIGTSS